MSDNTEMMAKIMALLAKAESTEFEHEANAFLAKAQELMIKHAIAESDLKPEEREKITVVRIVIGTQRPNHMLWNVVSGVNDVKFVRDNNTKGVNKKGWLYGFPSDIAFVQSLVASLMLQRESALLRTTKPWDENGRSYNHAFRVAFASRINKRMNEAKKTIVEDSQPGTALVLASKAAQVDVFVTANAGPLTKGAPIYSRSRAGYERGERAGNRADVSGGRNHVGGSRTALAG